MTAALHLIAGLAFLGAVHAASQGPSPTPGKDRHKQQADTEHTAKTPQQERGGSQDAPLFVKVVPTPPSQEQLTSEANERQEKAASDGKLVTWTAVLAWATLVLMVFTGINLLILRGQRDELREQRGLMQKQASHLEEQAVQLRASVATMKDTAERQLRPYVFIEMAAIGNVALTELLPGTVPTEAQLTRPLEGPMALIVSKNTGQTPAFDVISWTKIHVAEFPLRTPLPSPSATYVAKGALAPGATTSQRVTWRAPLTALELTDLREGRVAIYVYGHVSYRDQFGKHRTTRLRFMHGSMSGPIGVSTELTICDEGNDAD